MTGELSLVGFKWYIAVRLKLSGPASSYAR